MAVDTGIGNKQSEKFFSYYYLNGDYSLEKSLSKHGFAKDDITDVILTHLHLDHAGGAVSRIGEDLVPTFKNATYWTNEQHWAWAMNPNDRERASFLSENLLPLQQAGQLSFINPKSPYFLPDCTFKVSHGHTEAMMLPQLKYKGNTILFAADLVPTLGHLPIPYVAGYDVFPLKSMEEKKAILQEACDNKYILFFEHDAVNECCTLIQTEKGVRAGDVFRLSEI